MTRRKSPGTIVRIDLGDGTHTYGRELVHPYLAVYDVHTTDALGAADVISCSPLFFVAVFDAAMNRWEKVGHVPLQARELPIPEQFNQDPVDPTECRIVDSEGNERWVTIDECEGLEAATTWDSDEVEQRVRDHYAGTPNKKMQRLKLRRLEREKG